jgi:hypothetical protein
MQCDCNFVLRFQMGFFPLWFDFCRFGFVALLPVLESRRSNLPEPGGIFGFSMDSERIEVNL